MREKSETPGVSYDGPKDAKKVDLAKPSEEPRLVWIATHLQPDEEELLLSTLREYRDIFAWSYKDLKGCGSSNFSANYPNERRCQAIQTTSIYVQ